MSVITRHHALRKIRTAKIIQSPIWFHGNDILYLKQKLMWPHILTITLAIEQGKYIERNVLRMFASYASDAQRLNCSTI